MAGQVKHKQIFSSIRPDWRLAKLLLSLGTRNTDSLLGAVAKVLADEGITLENSTSLLGASAAKTGVLSQRRASEQERKTSTTGGLVPRAIWLNTTSARRWWSRKMPASRSKPWRAPMPPSSARGRSWRRSNAEASTLSRALTVVKIAKPNQDMRFDVPVIGVKTIEVMRRRARLVWRWMRGNVCCSMEPKSSQQQMGRGLPSWRTSCVVS